jgi:hypothetical protein
MPGEDSPPGYTSPLAAGDGKSVRLFVKHRAA